MQIKYEPTNHYRLIAWHASLLDFLGLISGELGLAKGFGAFF